MKNAKCFSLSKKTINFAKTSICINNNHFLLGEIDTHNCEKAKALHPEKFQ